MWGLVLNWLVSPLSFCVCLLCFRFILLMLPFYSCICLIIVLESYCTLLLMCLLAMVAFVICYDFYDFDCAGLFVCGCYLHVFVVMLLV